ncbi:glutathionylspermidine synthase family protein [Cellulomonas sp. SLBN-39]|uniref:glutathionylspermidine synthase family protein n=1 Tax=Cellulomonas sp. SLBN-39 TaxID=2768446 RepID=UPI001152E6AF|nr:glutathionylspermidine synthase family protein [Cellulomonas sp. SLBN-39]TQL02450.1 glutathionylspermidine synthase [Cellulomonas sp. SLBN-39]
MQRLPSTPRPGYRDLVGAQGLTYPDTPLPGGGTVPYWSEDSCYVISSDEADHLERATEELHAMSREAAAFLATGAMGDLGLPDGTFALVRDSLAAEPVHLYGRFDLAFDGTGPAKLLEYNADTPTGLVESAVVQWFWLMDTHPDRDQLNSVHERLVRRWAQLAPRLPGDRVHVAHVDHDTAYEEWATAAYLMDTAQQAGLRTVGLRVDEIGLDHDHDELVDLAGERIDTCFKLYPWENMLREPFGAHVMADPDGVRWVEPLWKVVVSNKALLAALWHLYPGHPHLLPAYLDDPGPLTAWVAKPLHGREGDAIRVHAPGVELTTPGTYGGEGLCYQAWNPLPDLDGHKAVIGSWVVGDHAAGIGVRESDGWVTDWYARFVPHVVDTPAPTDAQRTAWLDADAPRP